jgi:crotonobetainyl-CoA:carnitine CoA-transferase CaiB-like acyl-CoA transferase
VRTLPEVLDDPHFRERGAVVTDARGWDHVASPIRFMNEPARERYAVAALGEHTRTVLLSLGYAEGEIAQLCADGVAREATPEEIARHAGPDAGAGDRR